MILPIPFSSNLVLCRVVSSCRIASNHARSEVWQSTRIINKYDKCGLRVSEIFADNKFHPIIDAVAPIYGNLAAAGEHVGDIENHNKVLQASNLFFSLFLVVFMAELYAMLLLVWSFCLVVWSCCDLFAWLLQMHNVVVFSLQIHV